MIERLLPRVVDNAYDGRRLALWLLGLVLAVKTAQGVSVILDPYSLLSGADGVPVATFPPAAAGAVAALFAISGFSRLLLCLLGVGVLLRYRRAAPLMFGLLMLDYIGRELVLRLYPLGRVGNPVGPRVNLALFLLSLAGLALSLWSRRRLEAAAAAQRPETV